jgi:hypothetical protein
MTSTEAVSSPPVKPLKYKPQLTAIIDAGYKNLCHVCCFSEDEVWTCGDNNTLKLFNPRDDLLTSIQTKPRDMQGDIAVTQDGDHLYTDDWHKTVNIIKNNQTSIVIREPFWCPLCVCCSVAGDLIVFLVSDYWEQPSKVVRYSGSTEKQTIQLDHLGRPL